jgi:hypothetical protein
MKTLSKARVATIINNSTTTRPKELCPTVIIVVRTKINPEKLTIMRMILPSDCNAQLYAPKG